MSGKIFFLPAIGATTFLLVLFLFTKIFGPIPFSVTSVTTQKSTTFDVTGEGKVSVKPDTAIVTVGVAANGPSVNATQDQMNSIINKVSAGVKNLGVDSKDIQTTNYNVNPEYDYSGGAQKIKGYSASTNLQIKVREIDKANQVIDVATANGANRVNGPTFEVTDKTKAENEARQKAVTDAKKRAETAASVAGFTLGKLVNYSESSGGYGRPIPMMALSTKEDQSAPTQLESGSNEVTIIVTLSYAIE